MTHPSDSVDQTEAIAGDLARSLRAGDVIALEGDLGAGKTQFVRGLVKAFGGDGRAVSSPTYVLLHVYPTPTLTIYHLDAYRVHGPADFEQIGFEELLEQGGIVVLEWPSRVPGLLPEQVVRVQVETTGETSRGITIELKPDSGTQGRSGAS
jgi:tRNA threonylcarbamoyladenosine biosynthesis protein TsaE